MNNPMSAILQQFQIFRQNYKGDAQAEVQRIISSGQVPQERLNHIQNMASQIMRMLPR